MTPAQPRHPLALLADGWEIEGAQLCDGVHASVPNAHAGQAYLDCAAQLREALRAQAEAEAGLREALAYYADFDGEHVGALGQYFVRRQTLDREFVWRADRGQTARAALAQAGGES